MTLQKNDLYLCAQSLRDDFSTEKSQIKNALVSEALSRPDVDIVGQRRLRTRNINAGCGAFGLYFDLAAKEKDVVVSDMRV